MIIYGSGMKIACITYTNNARKVGSIAVLFSGDLLFQLLNIVKTSYVICFRLMNEEFNLSDGRRALKRILYENQEKTVDGYRF